MKVSVIAAIGRRGQLARDGSMPWHCSEDLKDFARATAGSIMIAGERTFKQIRPVMTDAYLDRTRRGLLGWSPRAGTPGELIAHLKDGNADRVWIIGGAYTYRKFHRYVNHDIHINVLSYDNDPAEDDRHLFFPLKLYGVKL